MSLDLFESKPPLVLLARFAWPSIINLFANGLYNAVDRAFVGQIVGTDALSAVTVIFPLTIAVFAAGLAIGQGVSTQVSLSLGAKNREEAEHALGQGIGLSAVISLVFLACLIPATAPLLALMATPAEIIGPATEYFHITLIGMPFLIFSMSIGMAIRSQGRAKTALLTGLVGLLANIILDVLFVGVFRWGLAGSAWATSIAQILGAAVTLFFYFTSLSSLRLRLANLLLKRDMALRIVSLGFPALIGNLIGMVLMIVLNIRVQSFGGSPALATIGVINTLANLFFMPAIGLVQGAVPLFGYYQGAGKPELNRKLFGWVLGITTAFFIVCTIVIEIWPEALLGIFSQDAELIAFALQPLRVFLMLMGLAGFIIIPATYFQAIGKPSLSTVLNLVRPISLALCVIILPGIWGFSGFLASGPISDGLGILTASFFMLRDRNLFPKGERNAPLAVTENT